MRKNSNLFALLGLVFFVINLLFGGFWIQIAGAVFFTLAAFSERETNTRVSWALLATVLLSHAFLPEGLIGLIAIFVYTPKMRVENLSTTFIELWEPMALISPQYWSTAIFTMGCILIVVGILLTVPWGRILNNRS